MGYDFYWAEPDEHEIRLYEDYRSSRFDMTLGDRWWAYQKQIGSHRSHSYGGFHKWYIVPMEAIGMIVSPPEPIAYPKDWQPDCAWDHDTDEHGETESCPTCHEWHRAFRAWRDQRVEMPGIPEWKFNGSDGRRIWPDEIMSALDIYEKRNGRDTVAELWHDAGDDDMDLWDSWIVFMRRAADHGGFTVD